MVVVKKKIGKWWVCIDFTTWTKPCPKDNLPLAHIDRLVDVTTGHLLLSVKDAFFGYNQILLHLDDSENTTFFTERGTYYYKVMPFGLKNTGVTYQQLINKMFTGLIGKTMEVYIDDMLMKSLQAEEHISHLEEYFQLLR